MRFEGRQSPLLLFDAADPANLGWFSRCQFYVDGASGAVLQTPIQLANQRDRAGHALPYAVRLQINKDGTQDRPSRQHAASVAGGQAAGLPA